MLRESVPSLIAVAILYGFEGILDGRETRGGGVVKRFSVG